MARTPRRVIHISKEVDDILNKKRNSKHLPKSQSYDGILRRLLGIKPRDPKQKFKNPRIFWIVPESNRAFRRKNEAVGESICITVRKQRKRILEPIKVREEL